MTRGRRGVTLQELVIAIAVMAIVAAIALMAIDPVKMAAKRRDAQRIADLQVMQTAIDAYTAKYKVPPGQNYIAYFSECTRRSTLLIPPGNCDLANAKDPSGNGWIGSDPGCSGCNLGLFIPQLRLDPINVAEGTGVDYGIRNYWYIRVGSKYLISAAMEQNKDAAKKDGCVGDFDDPNNNTPDGFFWNRYDVGTLNCHDTELIDHFSPW